MFHVRLHLRSRQPIGQLYAVNFLTALGLGSLTPFLTIYFATLVPVAAVGLIIGGSYVVSIAANVFGTPIIARLHERRTMIAAMLGTAICLLGLGFIGHAGAAVLLFVGYTFLQTLIWYNMDLFVKHYSIPASLAGNEGKVGLFDNLGWMIAPFIAGLAAARYGLPVIFPIAALFLLIALGLFVELPAGGQQFKAPKRDTLAAAVRAFQREPELVRLYVIAFALAFLYAAWNFLPLWLQSGGADAAAIGMIFGLAALPWVLFEYPVGRWARTPQRQRRALIVGLLVAALATAAFGLTHSVAGLVVILLIGVTGTSFVERTHVAYFIQRVDEDDVERVGVWRTALGLGFVLGPLCASLMLTWASLSLFFVLAGVVTLAGVVSAWKLRSR